MIKTMAERLLLMLIHLSVGQDQCLVPTPRHFRSIRSHSHYLPRTCLPRLIANSQLSQTSITMKNSIRGDLTESQKTAGWTLRGSYGGVNLILTLIESFSACKRCRLPKIECDLCVLGSHCTPCVCGDHKCVFEQPKKTNVPSRHVHSFSYCFFPPMTLLIAQENSKVHRENQTSSRCSLSPLQSYYCRDPLFGRGCFSI